MGASSSQPVGEHDEHSPGQYNPYLYVSSGRGNWGNATIMLLPNFSDLVLTYKAEENTDSLDIKQGSTTTALSIHSEERPKRKGKSKKKKKKARKSTDTVESPRSPSVVLPEATSSESAHNPIQDTEMNASPDLPQPRSPVTALRESITQNSEDDLTAVSSQVIQDSQVAPQVESPASVERDRDSTTRNHKGSTPAEIEVELVKSSQLSDNGGAEGGDQSHLDVRSTSYEDTTPNSLPLLASDNGTSIAEVQPTSPTSLTPDKSASPTRPSFGSIRGVGASATPKKQKSLKAKTPLSGKMLRYGETAKAAMNSTPDSPGIKAQSQESNSSARRRKRRIPIEDLTDGATVGEPKQKKSRKSIGTPKPREPRRTESVASNKVGTPVRIRENSAATVSGPFTQEEMNIIKLQMQKFREAHDMSEYDQNQLIADGPSALSKELFNQICAELPFRDRISILKHCRRRYHNFGVRGAWTDDDDERLLQAYEQHPQQWRLIGKLIGRHQEDVRDRYRNYLVCGDQQKKSYWSPEEVIQLGAVVKEALEMIAEMKQEDFQRDPNSTEFSEPNIQYVDWNIVSEKLNHTRSRLQCIVKWKQLTAKGEMDLLLSKHSDLSNAFLQSSEEDEQLQVEGPKAKRHGEAASEKRGDKSKKRKRRKAPEVPITPTVRRRTPRASPEDDSDMDIPARVGDS